MRFLVLAFLVAAPASGCSGNTPTAADQAAIPVVSVAALQKAIFVDGRDRWLASIQRHSTMSVGAYYQERLATARDAPFIISGVRIAGGRSFLQAQAGTYAQLSKQFKTVGELWRATGYDPRAALDDPNHLATLVAALRTHHAALALKSCDQTCAAGPNMGPDPNQQPLIGGAATLPVVNVADIPLSSNQPGATTPSGYNPCGGAVEAFNSSPTEWQDSEMYQYIQGLETALQAAGTPSVQVRDARNSHVYTVSRAPADVFGNEGTRYSITGPVPGRVATVDIFDFFGMPSQRTQTGAHWLPFAPD